jgi:hypothetical protein
MNTYKWSITSGTIMLAALTVLVLAVGLTQAQGPELEGEAQPRAETGAAATASGAIPIQGRLTDASGNPLNGTYSIRFRLYDVETGGTPLCSDINSVSVADGLFSSYVSGCYNDLYGQKVWLGVEVENDGEMTPRQVIHSVPYALSLRPRAVISDSRDHVLTVRSTGSGTDDHDALMVYAEGDGEAVTANATDGTGIYSASENGYGIYGRSDTNVGIYGKSESGIGVYGKTDATNNFGVVGLQTGYSTDDLTLAYWEPAGFFGGRSGAVGVTKDGEGYGVVGFHNTSSGGGAGVVGATLSPDGWAASFSTGAGNGVYIAAPAGKVGLNVAGGTKNAVVSTDGGARLLYTEESTQVWFTDYGFGKLDDGVAIIPIASIFAQTVNLEEPYHVFVQVYGDAEVYVTNRTSAQFEVRLRDGDPNTVFSYRIVAKRLGYEDHRLERAPWADDDPNLFPETSDSP